MAADDGEFEEGVEAAMSDATKGLGLLGRMMRAPCGVTAWAILTISAVLARLAASAMAAGLVAGGAMSGFAPANPPAPVPDLAVTDANGAVKHVSDYKGRVVLLNFWATWCQPCVKEMPSIQALQRQLGGDGFKVLPVSEDRGGIAVVRKFFDDHGLDGLDMLVDKSPTTLDAFHLRGLPTTLLIGRDGKEIGRLEGEARWDSPEARALISHFIEDAPRDDAPIKADAPASGEKPAG